MSNRLLDPLELRCGLLVRNRIALAPLTNRQSHPDGTLGEDEHRWLARRAVGGFGWVSTCAAYVCDEGKAWAGQLGIANEAHEESLRPLAAALRAAGSAAVVQLHHAGAKADLAPDQRLSTADDVERGIRGATAADLERVTAEFVAAAQRAERAGFAGVEIHGANGYLFTQFLAPADNPRRDAFGGSLARRAKFLRRTLTAVRAGVGAGFAVGVRISPVDVWAERGLVLEDGLQLGRWLAEDGADFVHLSLSAAMGTPRFQPEAGVVTTAFREVLPAEVAIFTVGGIWTPADAIAALDAGADVVALGRAAIANPDWPQHADDPSWEPARPPWSTQLLREAAVGEGLLSYLTGFRGLLESAV